MYYHYTISQSQAQPPLNDSSSIAALKELNLTDEQKRSIKQLIRQFKLEDRKRRRLLRHRIFMQLNVQQQMAIRRMWRKQFGH
jgi:hypothetical protein